MLTRADWHQRYRQQAGWTQSIREHLYRQASLEHAHRVLEVGCGTGAITGDLRAYTPAEVFGIDLRLDDLSFARQQDPHSRYSAANALSLPFPDGAFDACLCHFFLLWVGQPERALGEMVRVTRRGGSILALAEPDYGGRIDFPPELARLGEMQAAGLTRQGAYVRLGRALAALLRGAGLREVQVGLLGGQWQKAGLPAGWDQEWDVLAADLTGQMGEDELKRLREIDRRAWETGERILFVPTFYGFGRIF